MSNEEKGSTPQRRSWSSSEIAEHWQQDAERRRQDFADATQRMIEAAELAQGASSHSSHPLALSDPTVFEQELTEADFSEVSTRPLAFQSHYPSLDAFMDSTASRLIAGVMEQLNLQEQQQLLEEVKQAVSQFEGPHGFVAPAEMLLAVGCKEIQMDR